MDDFLELVNSVIIYKKKEIEEMKNYYEKIINKENQKKTLDKEYINTIFNMKEYLNNIDKQENKEKIAFFLKENIDKDLKNLDEVKIRKLCKKNNFNSAMYLIVLECIYRLKTK